MPKDYHLRQTGAEVQALLDMIKLATTDEPGLMSAEDKLALDELVTNGLKYNTTEYWNNVVGYIPAAGEIIVYSDYSTIEEAGQTKNVPAIKIGTGNAYVQDLAFIDDAVIGVLAEHLSDMQIHITDEERALWNNKLNVDDHEEVLGETLVFNRD